MPLRKAPLQDGPGAFAAQSRWRRDLGDHGALAAERPSNGGLENTITAVWLAAEDQLAGMPAPADAPNQAKASAIERRCGAGPIGEGSIYAHEKA
jgi:hypothetical protein